MGGRRTQRIQKYCRQNSGERSLRPARAPGPPKLPRESSVHIVPRVMATAALSRKERRSEAAAATSTGESVA